MQIEEFSLGWCHIATLSHIVSESQTFGLPCKFIKYVIKKQPYSLFTCSDIRRATELHSKHMRN